MFPQLIFRLNLIEENARNIVNFSSKFGIKVFGVTKVSCGFPPVAWAMVRGGVVGIADSRLVNLVNLKRAGLNVPLMLLRPPSPLEAKLTVETADISINTSLETMRVLSRAALTSGRKHKVLLGVECGDLREGILPEKVPEVSLEVEKLKGLELLGVATNFGCLSGVLPTRENTGLLVKAGKEAEQAIGRTLEVFSGGATVSLSLLERGEMPEGINQLRIGEGIVCGTDTSGNRLVPGTRQDTCILRATVLEVETKENQGNFPLGRNAFGEEGLAGPEGPRRRAVLSLGRIDVDLDRMVPLESGVKIVGASSDHLVLDVTEREVPTVVGETISFALSYQAVLRASVSPYVEKKFQPSDYFKEGL
ncbi:MAG: alanine/ornithine racemase family PLP-dependent enzyme [Caldiserica bacterium]|jgi:predicted amino acid racemase|nr:alanine/ornithine racemase family PLP-dependent enzyme [Caldisericota bacterium]MDH7562498.1 alanine/ornithine racemase family PLP-dependent enzyme [Caldisericota bacterium]